MGTPLQALERALHRLQLPVLSLQGNYLDLHVVLATHITDHDRRRVWELIANWDWTWESQAHERHSGDNSHDLLERLPAGQRHQCG